MCEALFAVAVLLAVVVAVVNVATRLGLLCRYGEHSYVLVRACCISLTSRYRCRHCHKECVEFY